MNELLRTLADNLDGMAWIVERSGASAARMPRWANLSSSQRSSRSTVMAQAPKQMAAA